MTQYEAIVKNPAWDAADIEQVKLMLCHRLATVLDIDIDAIRRGVLFFERQDFSDQVLIVASFTSRRDLHVVWARQESP